MIGFLYVLLALGSIGLWIVAILAWRISTRRTTPHYEDRNYD